MTNPLEEYWPLFQLYQKLRPQLLEVIDDDDLTFSPGGVAPTLGELCRELGETQRSYIDSFRTFALDFSYRHPDPSVIESVAALRAWYEALDAELAEAIGALSAEDATNRVVDRGGNFRVPLHIQLDIYKEALLIFCGKVWVYLKVMGKAAPEQWREWIG